MYVSRAEMSLRSVVPKEYGLGTGDVLPHPGRDGAMR